MTYSVTFNKSVTANYESCPQLPAILSCDIISVAGFSDNGLFVHKQDPTTLAQTFSHIASPCDLELIPLNVAKNGFLRLASMTKTYTTADAATTGVAVIEAGLSNLCYTMNRITVMGSTQTVTVTS